MTLRNALSPFGLGFRFAHQGVVGEAASDISTLLVMTVAAGRACKTAASATRGVPPTDLSSLGDASQRLIESNGAAFRAGEGGRIALYALIGCRMRVETPSPRAACPITPGERDDASSHYLHEEQR